MKQKSALRSQLFIIFAALLFSTGGVAIKSSSLNAWRIAGFRSGIAALVLFLFIPGARRDWGWPLIAVATAYAATLISFVIATRNGTAAHAIFLQSTAPLYLLALSPWLLREQIRRHDLIVFAAIAIGMFLLLHDGFQGRGSGNIAGLFSGMAWACTLTGLRWLEKQPARGSSQGAVALGNLIAFIVCLPISVPLTSLPLQEIGILAYLGVFQISLAYLLLTQSIREVPAVKAATLLLIEPVFNPLWTWLIQGENPGPFAMAGGAVIILSSAYSLRYRTAQ